MAKNRFDQAARLTVKQDAPGFLGWALSLAPADFTFVGWLDTRHVPFPGETERTGDSVARLKRPGGTAPPWVLAVEFQTEPDPLIFGRLMVYQGLLWQAVKPDEERGSRFEIGSLVVNLTGSVSAARRMEWPEAELLTVLKPRERNLENENADELLKQIEAGTHSRWLLPWIPLMTGGDADIIERWKLAAEGETDFHRRNNMGLLARVFAEVVDRKPIWDKALERWNVRESTLLNELFAERDLAVTLANVIAVLEVRLGKVPADLEAEVRAATNLADAKGWFTLALKATDFATFRNSAGL